MAITKAEAKLAFPLSVYNYLVFIGKDTVAFSEVSGLNITYEKITYKESHTEPGKIGPRMFLMPAQPSPVTLTLKKGLVPAKSQAALYDWINSVSLNQVEKKDIVVSLCDETGAPMVSWTVINAFPTKLQAPSFTATSNEAAIESMELTGDSLLINYAP
jgi:phage tail-like protein